MSSFKKYFLYIFKKTALRQAVTCFICVIIALLQINGWEEYYSPSSVATILGVLCMLIPILELAPFKNRRNLDSLFSLPVSRKKQALAHYINGVIQISVAFTVCCVLALIQLIAYKRGAIIGYFIAYYFLALVAGILIYSVFMLLFDQANTVIDGILFEILGAFALFFVAQAVRNVIGTVGDHPYPTYIIFDPIGKEGLYQIVKNCSFSIYWKDIIMILMWSLIGVASIIGYFYAFERKKVENVGGISDSFLGYKLLIPVWAYSLLALLGSFSGMIIFIYLSMLIGYIIYRRGFKFTRQDLICMAMTIPFCALGVAV